MRILIVEDDRDLAAALDDALRFEGYATRVAYNGLEAVRMLAEQSIDIVLLDRDLPIMSGDAVMETIASNDIPVSVLMLTAAAQVRDRINGLELGADDYLIKPFAIPSYSRAYGRCNAVPVRATSPAPNSHTTASSSTRSVTP